MPSKSGSLALRKVLLPGQRLGNSSPPPDGFSPKYTKNNELKEGLHGWEVKADGLLWYRGSLYKTRRLWNHKTIATLRAKRLKRKREKQQTQLGSEVKQGTDGSRGTSR